MSDEEPWHRGELARLQTLWENTQNPLYAWHAIAFCSHRSHPFPPWCLEYLRITADRIEGLGDGYDFRDAPRPWLEASLEPDKAVERLPEALGFTTQGGNAFRNAQKLRAKGSDLLRLNYLTRIEGKTKKTALKQIAEENGNFHGTRNIERHINEYKQAHTRES